MPEAQAFDAPLAGQTPVEPSPPQSHPHAHDAFFNGGTGREAMGPQHDELLDELDDELPEDEELLL